jgi:hypothetical protein
MVHCFLRLSLIATAICIQADLNAAPLTFALFENGTSNVAAYLSLDGPAPYTYEDVSALTFTEYGADELERRVIQNAPLLAQYGYNIPAGPFTGEFIDDPNGAAILDPAGTGLIGINGEFATIFAFTVLPRPFSFATVRLNFGAPTSSQLTVDEIRIIPSASNGAAIHGEWLLIPEPSSVALLAACIAAIRRRPPARHFC